MRVITCDLKTSKMILPNIELHTCDSVQEIPSLILLYKPDLVAVSDAVAEEVVNLASEIGMPLITVVMEQLTSKAMRDWIAMGAKEVLSFSEWEQLMTSVSDSKEAAAAVEMRFEQDLPRSTFVIGVGGVSDGLGTTHTSILIANYLSRTLKTQVAIWEAGLKPCFQFLDYTMNGEIGINRPRFDMKNLTLFKAGVAYHQMKSAAADFRYVVLDLGCINTDKERAEKFFNSDMPILVGSGIDWRFREIIQFCQSQQKISQEHWRVTLPLASVESTDDMIEFLKGRPVFSIPLHIKPFEPQEETDECMEAVLSPLLPKKRKHRFFGF